MTERKTYEKFYPKVGDQLYLQQKTGSYYVDLVKRPYTVIGVTSTKVIIQRAKCIFPVFKYDPETMDEYYKKYDGQRVQFYDTLAESIVEDKNGRIEELIWKPSKGKWGTKGSDRDYPEYAHFGKYRYYPYLD